MRWLKVLRCHLQRRSLTDWPLLESVVFIVLAWALSMLFVAAVAAITHACRS